jgi:signal transduction histidine kinase/CheY-like chemotaxis protein
VSIDTIIAAVADFERLPVPGGVFDLDGTILAGNAAATRLLGRPANQLVGRKAWDFAPGAEHIWREVVAAAGAADYHGKITIATPTGPRAIHYVASLRTHETRTVLLLFAVEISSSEDEDRAQRLESLGRVAGGIAHDFNNQLVSVLAEATSAREDATLGQGVRDSLRRIEAAAQRMAHLTRQLLSYAGRGRFVTQPIAPDALLREMQDQLTRSVRPEAELTLHAAAPSATVEADRNMLREVILNLVVNASEALQPSGGKIRVATTIQPREGDGSWWRFEVTDDGIGMDAGTVARMFDPFFTTKADHHGLGLSAVHGIVRRLGGQISVDSKPGTGTTIVLALPIVAGMRPLIKDTPSAPYRGVSLRGLSILVADDEPSVRSTIRRLLERRGATVVVATDGGEAETHLREATFALVLLDVMMPRLTGYQLLPIVRETQPNARVLLMSGFTDGARGGTQEEADAFLEKPFTAKQMDDAIDSLLER